METLENTQNEPETRDRDKKNLLYKKATRNLLPKNALLGAGSFQVLNTITQEDLKDIIKIAFNEAKKRGQTTIRPSDIKTARQELGKLNSGEFIDKIQTALESRIKEIRQNETEKKAVLING